MVRNYLPYLSNPHRCLVSLGQWQRRRPGREEQSRTEDNRDQFLKVRQESGMSVNDLIPALGWGVLKNNITNPSLAWTTQGDPVSKQNKRSSHN